MTNVFHKIHIVFKPILETAHDQHEIFAVHISCHISIVVCPMVALQLLLSEQALLHMALLGMALDPRGLK